MSAIYQTFPVSPAIPARRVRVWIAAPKRKPAHPSRSFGNVLVRVMVLALLVVIGLIWMLVGGEVMRGAR